MREIKFRVWDKALNKMITQENVIELLDKINSEEWETGYPYSSDEWYPAYQILGIFDYFNDIQKQGIKRYEPSENRFEIMQYTGLKDKNGKEIYEGDIVEILWYYRKTRYVVKYGEYKIDCCGCCYNEHNAYGFYLEHIKLRDAQQSINDDEYAQQSINDDEIVEIVVIGNIYENPELLEE